MSKRFARERSARIKRKARQAAALKVEAIGPSKLLMSAALSGLLGLNAGCGDETTTEEADPTHDDAGGSECMCEPEHDAGGNGGAIDAGACEEVDAGEADAGPVEVDKEISTTDVQHTYAELTAMCNEQNGYVELIGSCSGSNTCQGFTYGDWDEESQLLEHSCAGANGCVGLSCLIPARAGATRDMTGEEVMKLDDAWYKERVGTYGPKPCRQCHIKSEFNEAIEDYEYDYTILRMPVMPGSGRTADNWTQRSALYQEKAVAFGLMSLAEDGTLMRSMVSYAKLLSKEEIRRVVEYMRKYAPDKIEVKDLRLTPGKQP